MRLSRYVFLSFELTILFVALPLFLITPIFLGIKIATVLICVLYFWYVNRNVGVLHLSLDWRVLINRGLTKTIYFRFLFFALASSVFMYYQSPEQLFDVLLAKPFMWLLVCLVYVVLSVLPQELIYRVFFYERYKDLIKNRYVLIVLNAFVFSLAHLFFENLLVLVLTFVGGVFFSLSYFKTRSYLFICLEHALYGVWLFTVGMGKMLAFPGL